MPNNAFKIASRLYFAQSGENRHSRPAVRVALAGMIVGVIVMILTICIVVGFKQTITDKIAGFGAHIQVVSFDNNNTYDMQPIEVSDSLLSQLSSFPHVVTAVPFITKPGMLKTDSAFQGMVALITGISSREILLKAPCRLPRKKFSSLFRWQRSCSFILVLQLLPIS